MVERSSDLPSTTAEADLRLRVDELSRLQQAGRLISGSMDLDRVIALALEATCRATEADVALLFTRRDGLLELRGRYPDDAAFAHVGSQVARVGECLCGLAAQGQAVYSEAIENDDRCVLHDCKQAGLHAFAALPLMIGDRCAGILTMASRQSRDFRRQSHFLETIAGQVAVAMEKASLFKNLREQAQELADTSTLLETVLNTIPDVIGVMDVDHRVLRYNTAGYRFVKRSPEEVIGRKCYELLGRDDRCERCATDKAIKTKRPARVERFVPEMDIWVDVRAYPILDADGNLVRIVEHVRDITREKQAKEDERRLQERMQQAQKFESLGVLAGGIAHDFNNLLMVILGNASLALAELPGASPVVNQVRDIETSARRAAELCKELLAYSGKGRFMVEALDLSSVVKETHQILLLSVSKQTTLDLRLADELPPVRADASQMRQVLINLVSNGSDALGDRTGTVTVVTGVMECDEAYLRSANMDGDLPAGTYVFAEVSDTGCGIDPEAKKKIFDPFYTTKFAGRGLGLAAVLGIVRGHRGAIRVYSESGKGSTFKVLLPAVQQGAPASEPAGGDAARDAPVALKGTVLLVDDEAGVRSTAKRMLLKLGLDVVTAADGREAVDIYTRHPERIQCVLLDLTMPRMDGIDAFRELRRVNPEVRVLLTSGYNASEVNRRFAGKGLAGFIQKPYRLDALHRALGKVLG